MSSLSAIATPVEKIQSGQRSSFTDLLAIEEPLEIRILFGPETQREEKVISLTMRTPGNDAELAAGFLFTEGIVDNPNQLVRITHNVSDPNTICLELDPKTGVALNQLERNFYTTSSCGICGKTSVDAIRVRLPFQKIQELIQLPSSFFLSLPEELRKQQSVFEQTGGLHASALFDLSGELLMVKEDVGRHNALDKLIGSRFLSSSLPLDQQVLLLSGRASFELIQKAAIAGIRIVAAIGAPSSLAVELAKEMDMTLIGFLKPSGFNLYSGGQRILL